MEEHELRASLQRLPDARPGAEFTAEVLARVERHERQRATDAGHRADDGARAGAPRWRPTLLAAGLAAALIAAVGLWQPLAGGLLGGGGGEVAVSAGARPELPAERGGGDRASGGEATAPAAGVSGDLGGGAVTTSGLADAGVGATNGAPPSAVATPGTSGRITPRAGSGSPQGNSSQPSALGDQGSAATDAEGSLAEERLASATVVAGGADDGSGADGREGAAPPAAALPGDTFATLPTAQRLARLRAEREALERRLVAFRRELPPAEPPVVLLGGDEGLELVFDLGGWAAAPPAGEAAGAARPAVHSTQGPPRRF